ncbi:mRNA capping enzyme, catalytic domain-containing protein [Polychytrium aggregatum]|uniref:mRNA capping enzyme, catalytic domain-containing protein n=1 Tax=Polychytrium aggregatum TaxID=110093 RepID=UPI0022FDE43E|nr:mRNA capping enzyme, catalytic domain-containing protein [Polychytrium aggregatum]KAI9205521.1 mRNA capping enzyme, catalytic domain-containing protein [Polychytrium aggregatum]
MEVHELLHTGIKVDHAYQEQLRAKVKELLSWKYEGFAGSQPVSFQLQHLSNLENEDYFVCEKSDGVRYMMILVVTQKGPAGFLIDRMNNFFYLPMHFPLSKLKQKSSQNTQFHNDTLMDGELVIDVQGDKKIKRFLVFDLMAVNGVSIVQRSFSTRLGILQQDVIEPHTQYLKSHPQLQKSAPFSVEMKDQQRSYGMNLVFQDIPNLKHANDGLIFTPVKEPYMAGTCTKLLKWKPPDMNTVDFQIKKTYTAERKPRYQLYISRFGVHRLYEDFSPDPDTAEKWRNESPDGRIGEFRYDPNLDNVIYESGYAPQTRKGGWVFIKYRDDKDKANEEHVVTSVIASIKDGVTKDILENRVELIRKKWKARERMLISASPVAPQPSNTDTSESDAKNLSSPSGATRPQPPPGPAPLTRERGSTSSPQSERVATKRVKVDPSTSDEAIAPESDSTRQKSVSEKLLEQRLSPLKSVPSSKPEDSAPAQRDTPDRSPVRIGAPNRIPEVNGTAAPSPDLPAAINQSPSTGPVLDQHGDDDALSSGGIPELSASQVCNPRHRSPTAFSASDRCLSSSSSSSSSSNADTDDRSICSSWKRGGPTRRCPDHSGASVSSTADDPSKSLASARNLVIQLGSGRRHHRTVTLRRSFYWLLPILNSPLAAHYPSRPTISSSRTPMPSLSISLSLSRTNSRRTLNCNCSRTPSPSRSPSFNNLPNSRPNTHPSLSRNSNTRPRINPSSLTRAIPLATAIPKAISPMHRPLRLSIPTPIRKSRPRASAHPIPTILRITHRHNIHSRPCTPILSLYNNSSNNSNSSSSNSSNNNNSSSSSRSSPICSLHQSHNTHQTTRRPDGGAVSACVSGKPTSARNPCGSQGRAAAISGLSRKLADNHHPSGDGPFRV